MNKKTLIILIIAIAAALMLTVYFMWLEPKEQKKPLLRGSAIENSSIFTNNNAGE